MSNQPNPTLFDSYTAWTVQSSEHGAVLRELNQALADQLWTTAQQKGEQILQLADHISRAHLAPSINVVSFSLFGADPLYCETALLNAQAMPSVYPGWQMWLYHDASVPAHVLGRLKQAGVHLFAVDSLGITHWPGTFWRFFAVSDPRVASVSFRDADSVVGAQEAQWVAEWQASKKVMHVMRDWYSHTDLVLAGLWGAWAPALSGMVDWINAYVATEKLHPTHADQNFLAQAVWPRFADVALVHDAAHPALSTRPMTPIPVEAKSFERLGGFLAKQITATLPHADCRYALEFKDQNQNLICRYERVGGSDCKDSFYVPSQYYDRTVDGGWTLNFIVLPTVTVIARSSEASALP